MQIATYVAIYFVFWWLSFIMVLPWGNKSQAELGYVTPGTEEGAPAQPRLRMKCFITSILAAFFLGTLYWLLEVQGITLDDFPFARDINLY